MLEEDIKIKLPEHQLKLLENLVIVRLEMTRPGNNIKAENKFYSEKQKC